MKLRDSERGNRLMLCNHYTVNMSRVLLDPTGRQIREACDLVTLGINAFEGRHSTVAKTLILLLAVV